MSKPNILIFMVDQLNGTLFPDGPADWLHAPNLKKLAARSTRFGTAYTASPLCAPGRASFMSGQLPSRTRVYDNAAEFASDIPTYAHHLRRAGYQTCLSGKMHFVGPDQMHGFEERLTTDIYPADFGWTPDYRKPGERIDWWYHNMGSVTGAGVAEITNQMEYDDEVAYHATRKLYDLSRGHDDRPWCLTVSFTHPHDPYVARKKYWDLYADCDHLLPAVGPIPYAEQDAHSQRILDANDHKNFDITEYQIKRARRAYFANISYLDDKVGELLQTLEDTRQEATILFVSDHGDMLGEFGLWYKMSFREWSCRIPMIVHNPQRFAPSKISQPVAQVDVLPTLMDLALESTGIAKPEPLDPLSGRSLVPLCDGNTADDPNECVSEFLAEGTGAPMLMIRRAEFKYIHCMTDPDQLFDLSNDPNELVNLAGDHADERQQALLVGFREEATKYWDAESLCEDVIKSQIRRRELHAALCIGKKAHWDYNPPSDASEQYTRSHMDLTAHDVKSRFPKTLS